MICQQADSEEAVVSSLCSQCSLGQNLILSAGLAVLLHKAILESESSYDFAANSLFHQQLQTDALPSVSRVKYFFQVAVEERIAEIQILVVATIYVLRLAERGQLAPSRYTWRTLMLVAMLVAKKLLLDQPTETTLFEGIVSGFEAADIAQAEVAFCANLDFNLFVQQETYSTYIKRLKDPSRKIKRPISIKVKQSSPDLDALDNFG